MVFLFALVLQLGYWPSTLQYGPTIMQAQSNFVQHTAHSVLVTTNDLSQYYHFDPAAQLMIGQRLATAVNQVLAGN